MENDIIGSPVHILTIDSRYGQAVSAFTTYEGALRAVGIWVDMCWDLSQGIPNNIDLRIKEYYDFYAGESYNIVSTKIGE